MRRDFGQGEGSSDIGIVDVKMRGQRRCGLRALSLETQGEGGRINLARARHFAAYFAQLNLTVKTTESYWRLLKTTEDY
jgi:hypothetical protein